MSNRNEALEAMRKFVGVPYVYGGPIGLSEALQGTDCRGAVISCWEDADPGCMGGATYTGDMLDCMLGGGKWVEVGSDDLKAGDVVLTCKRQGVVGHTAMCDGFGGLIEEYPPEGRHVSWYDYPWEHFLHYTGDGDGGAGVDGGAGAYMVAVDALNVRDAPSLSGTVVATYTRGETIALEDAGLYADGYLWGRYTGATSGQSRYVAMAKVDVTETFLQY